MRQHLFPIPITLLLTVFYARGQGTFVYDQQSSDESRYLEGGADIQQSQPIGQSFTPSLPAVGFIRLYIYNGILGDTSAATIYVNLRTDSISGLILAATIPVSIPGGAGFARPVDFLFASDVPVTPGVTYYFQPVVQDNNNLGLNQSFLYNYSGGTAFFQGSPALNNDLWFREGIVVPEPSSALLVMVGVGAFLFVRRSRQRTGLVVLHMSTALLGWSAICGSAKGLSSCRSRPRHCWLWWALALSFLFAGQGRAGRRGAAANSLLCTFPGRRMPRWCWTMSRRIKRAITRRR